MSSPQDFERSHSRIERALWAVAILLPLLSLAALATAGLLRQAPPLDSGNPVLDAFLSKAAENGSLARLHRHRYNRSAQPRLTREEILALEPQWGREADYWLLASLLLTRPNPKSVPETAERSASERFREGRISWLRLAKERNVLSGSLLSAYLRQDYYFQRMLLLTDENAASHNLPGYVSMSAPIAEQRENQLAWQQALDEVGSPGPELTSLLKQVCPDEAMPCYLAAQLACQRGDHALAIAELRAGNRKPQCSLLSGPARNAELVQLAADNDGRDLMLLGLLQPLSSAGPRLDFIYTDLAELAVETSDRELLAELQLMSRRICESPEADLFELSRTAGAAAGSIEKALNGWQSRLLPDEQARLSALLLATQDLATRLRKERQADIGSWLPDKWLEFQVSPDVSNWRFDRCFPLLAHSLAHDGRQALTQAQMAERALLDFRELSRFSFVTMDWEGPVPASVQAHMGQPAPAAGL